MSKSNYYEVLNLKQDCSAQDIKNSFIELSKKYHPDKSSDKAHHATFVKINEAYSILSKRSTRRLYDYDMNANVHREYHQYYDNVYSTRKPWTGKPRGFGNEPYYGFKGIKKVPNSVILTICLIFASVGIGVEYLAITKSVSLSQEKLMHDSARNYIFLEKAREEAARNGNDEQVRKFQQGQLKSMKLSEANETYAKRLFQEQEQAK